MSSAHGKKIREHLGFLGYEIEDIETEDQSEWFVANSDQKGNIVFKVVPSGFTLITIRWNGFKKKIVGDKNVLSLLNRLNRESFISKWTTRENEADATLIIETVYEGYDKTIFVTVLEQIEEEMGKGLQEFQRYTKNK